MKWLAMWHPVVDANALMSTTIDNEEQLGKLIEKITTLSRGGRIVFDGPNRSRTVIMAFGDPVPIEDFAAGKVPDRGSRPAGQSPPDKGLTLNLDPPMPPLAGLD